MELSSSVINDFTVELTGLKAGPLGPVGCGSDLFTIKGEGFEKKKWRDPLQNESLKGIIEKYSFYIVWHVFKIFQGTLLKKGSIQSVFWMLLKIWLWFLCTYSWSCARKKWRHWSRRGHTQRRCCVGKLWRLGCGWSGICFRVILICGLKGRKKYVSL